jgi:hypothetical protein
LTEVEVGCEACHLACMTDKASPAGWVVQVTIEAPARSPDAKWRSTAIVDAPSFQYFNVAIAAPNKAIEAATKYLAKAETKEGEMSVVRGLSAGEIAALSLTAGEVKAA